MGFHDIQNFNLAMLTKQGWPFLLDQDSLLHRCFKAKYFPKCNFLEAVGVPNSSYVWKSIIVAQPILRRDYCLRVGNSLAIQVLKDKWIPNHPTNRVLHQPLAKEWEWRVSVLINWNIRVWDRQQVEMKFHKVDANAILRIPLSHGHVADT